MDYGTPTTTQWAPACNGAGQRRWFLFRKLPGHPQEQLEDGSGRVRRFASEAAARRAALKLSRQLMENDDGHGHDE